MNNIIRPLFDNTQTKIDANFLVPDAFAEGARLSKGGVLLFVLPTILSGVVSYKCNYNEVFDVHEGIIAEETNTAYKTIINQLNSLSLLSAGWNNDPAAQPISKEIIENIKGILKQSEDKYLLGWNAFPCINGSVLLDLSINDRVDASINFAKDKISAFFRTSYTQEILDNVDYNDQTVVDFLRLVFLHKTSCATFLQ